jgi:hypothetical protein
MCVHNYYAHVIIIMQWVLKYPQQIAVWYPLLCKGISLWILPQFNSWVIIMKLYLKFMSHHDIIATYT